MGSFDRPRSHSFYDVKLVSPEKGRKGGEGEGGGEVRSLGADEIKRDDLAIHASSGVAALDSGTRFGSNHDQFSIMMKSAL